jgi:histidinol-phosphate aminotransferase
VPLEDFRFDLEAVLQAITARTKLIFICNPNNPTGTIVTKEEVGDFLAEVPEDILVVFDEAYHEYVEDENYPDTLSLLKQGQKNIIILRTFSKIYGLAGLRIGYAFSSPEIISLIERTREPFNVNLAAQIAAAAALDDKDHLQKSKEVNRRGKEILEEGFKALGLSYIPTQANFIFVDTKMNSCLLFEALLRQGIIVRTGDIFGKDNFLRVSIGTVDENKRFLEILAAVLKKEEEQNLSRK